MAVESVFTEGILYWHDFCILSSMSIFEGLNVATRGLAASQLGINVTGQNLTNAGTEGYSRKRIEQHAEWRRDGSFGQMGFGVEVYAINRIRNQFVDRMVNDEQSRYGFFTMKDAAYTRIENIFNETNTDHALNTLLNNFWNGWADLHNNPESIGARETLRSTTESLVTQFHSVMTQLSMYKDTINNEIEARVMKINQLTASIHTCNILISESEGPLKYNANDTRDQRDKLLQELALLVDVDYFEDERGVLNVSTSGHTLVSPAKNHLLLIERSLQQADDGSEYARVDVSFELTGKPFNSKSGELRALIDIRDIDIPKYEKSVNEVARTLITEVNKIHNSGYGLLGSTHIEFFDSDPRNFNASNISLAQAIKNDVNDIAAATGGLVRTAEVSFSTTAALALPGDAEVLSFANLGDDRFRYLVKNSFEIRDINGDLLQEGKDYDVDYNAATITFKYSAIDNPFAAGPLDVNIVFKHHDSGFSGPGDGSNALLISQLRDKALMQGDVFGNDTQTINQFYSGMLGRLGAEHNEATSSLETRSLALFHLKERQDEIMGVDMNEEIASLIQYQHTYQASARYLTTLTTMLDTLLNM
jgi:flagellar hook-associated protein 1 FlgK